VTDNLQVTFVLFTTYIIFTTLQEHMDHSLLGLVHERFTRG